MNVIAMIAIALLIMMGLFHFYWALGGKIGLDKALPTKDGKRLLNPGKPLTFLVGLVLLGFSYIAYVLQFYDATTLENSRFYSYSGFIISTLFVLRSIGEFNAVGFFKKIKNTEFAIYDTKYYSPLCLILGLVFALLIY